MGHRNTAQAEALVDGPPPFLLWLVMPNTAQNVAKVYVARRALLPTGFADNVRICVAQDGTFADISQDASHESAVWLDGLVLPGMTNLHSHAFQRAMAGLTERAGPVADTFWSWRQVMYRFLQELSPSDLSAIAAQLYIELLRGGFTHVVEFHYLHRDPAGHLPANPAENALTVCEAAAEVGISLTLLPSLYQQSGFGGAPLADSQRRFFLDDDEFARLWLWLQKHAGPSVRLGIAPHSLRAVTPAALLRSIAVCEQIDPTAPIHLHMAEQPQEVAASLAWSGLPPLTWLLDHVAVDARFCLIHATHCQPAELCRLARQGAVVGLCPSTEANLGDGLFAAPEFLAANGRFGIGTDSHVGTCALDELRLLEYGQRLRHGRRNVLCVPGQTGNDTSLSTGTTLWQTASRFGAQAAGCKKGEISPGACADLVVLDTGLPTLFGKDAQTALDAAMFGPERDAVSDVMVAGRWVVQNHHHPAEEKTAARYRQVVARLCR